MQDSPYLPFKSNFDILGPSEDTSTMRRVVERSVSRDKTLSANTPGPFAKEGAAFSSYLEDLTRGLGLTGICHSN